MLEITEALLEMHYHHAFVGAFESVFGARFVRLLKPSAQMEAWVGFDQGWVRSSLTTIELYDHLRESVQRGVAASDKFYLGYFLQFKVVQRVSRRSRTFPPNFPLPYYRSELSLWPNRQSGLSQHEILVRLSRIPQACVSYACPFIMSPDEIYDDPDLDRVQVVDVRSAPSGWMTNEPHYIAFRNERDVSPSWCSEPVPGRSAPFARWVRSDSAPRPLNGSEGLDLILTASRTMVGTPEKADRSPYLTEPSGLMPESFTIIEFVRVREGRERDQPGQSGS